MAGASSGVPIALGRRVGAVPATIGLLLAWILAYALAHAWKNTLGYFFDWLGGLGITVKVRGFGGSIHPFGFVKTVSRKILDWLFQLAAVSERGFVYCLNIAVEPYLLIIGTVLALGLVTYDALRALEQVTVRRQVRAITEPITARLRGIDALVGRIEAQAHAQWARLRNGIDRIEHIATRTLPHEVAALRSRVGYTSKQLRRLASRTSALERATVGVGAAALVARALSRLGLKWIRCGKVGRAGSALCGMDAQLLDALLGSALLVAGAFSLREMARDLQEPTALVAEGLDRLITELR